MSASSPTLCGIHTALDRIGLGLIKDKKQNCIFSPLSAALAVGLLVYDYDNPSAELWEWFGVDRDTSDADFADALKTLGDDFKSKEGNVMFWAYAVHRNAILSNRSIEYVKERMGVPIIVTGFPNPGVSMLNKAITEATRGLIPGMIYGADSEARLPLNVVYLRRVWSNLLERQETFDWLLPHWSYPVEFAGGEGEFKYASTSSYHYLALPYRDGSEMEIYMTKSRSQLPTNLTLDDMSVLRAQAKPRRFCLYIPIWTSSSDTDVLSLLSKSGVVFPRASKALQIKQSARISVDGYGTEACAATVGYDEDGCVLEGPISFQEFKVDRPFIYAIRCGPVTEFMGYLYKAEDIPGSLSMWSTVYRSCRRECDVS